MLYGTCCSLRSPLHRINNDMHDACDHRGFSRRQANRMGVVRTLDCRGLQTCINFPSSFPSRFPFTSSFQFHLPLDGCIQECISSGIHASSFYLRCVYPGSSYLPHSQYGTVVQYGGTVVRCYGDGPTVGALNAESPKIFVHLFFLVSWSWNKCFSYGIAPYFACAKLCASPMFSACALAP